MDRSRGNPGARGRLAVFAGDQTPRSIDLACRSGRMINSIGFSRREKHVSCYSDDVIYCGLAGASTPKPQAADALRDDAQCVAYKNSALALGPGLSGLKF